MLAGRRITWLRRFWAAEIAGSRILARLPDRTSYIKNMVATTRKKLPTAHIHPTEVVVYHRYLPLVSARNHYTPLERTNYLPHLNYWIPRFWLDIKRTRRNTQTCAISTQGIFPGAKERNIRTWDKIVAPLPTDRMEIGHRPLTYVGIDYFGLLHVKHGTS